MEIRPEVISHLEKRMDSIENAMMLLAKELHMEKQIEYEMFGRVK